MDQLTYTSLFVIITIISISFIFINILSIFGIIYLVFGEILIECQRRLIFSYAWAGKILIRSLTPFLSAFNFLLFFQK